MTRSQTAGHGRTPTDAMPLWHYKPRRELGVIAVALAVMAVASLLVVFGVMATTRPGRAAASSGVLPPTPMSAAISTPKTVS